DPLAGIIPRTLHQIFEKLSTNGTEFSVQSVPAGDLQRRSSSICSALPEVNEHLLMFDDPRNKTQVYQILERGSAKRKTASHLNERYSRRSPSTGGAGHDREAELGNFKHPGVCQPGNEYCKQAGGQSKTDQEDANVTAPDRDDCGDTPDNVLLTTSHPEIATLSGDLMLDSPDKELLRTIHAEIATLSGGVLFDESKYLSDVHPSETRKKSVKRNNIVSAPNDPVVKRRFGDVLTTEAEDVLGGQTSDPEFGFGECWTLDHNDHLQLQEAENERRHLTSDVNQHQIASESAP
ncbi:hypothetical protein AAFF_G00182500, partial [Aldrovandia affinis]